MVMRRIPPSRIAWLTRTDILMGVDQTEVGVPAEFAICSLLHVAAIEPLSPAPREPGPPKETDVPAPRIV